MYGATVRIGEGTDFYKFLISFSLGHIYYDPGIKMEGVSTARPKTKRLSQFRIKSGSLAGLYHKFAHVDVNTTDKLER